jgi:hypothetical protein
LQTSSFPDELKRRGYPLKEIAGGSRILHTARQPMQIAARRPGAGGAGLDQTYIDGRSWRRPAADQALRASGPVQDRTIIARMIKRGFSQCTAGSPQARSALHHQLV